MWMIRLILIGFFICCIIIGLQVLANNTPDIDVNDLINQLGADDWETRQTSHQKLLEWGKKLIQEYKQAKIAKLSEVNSKKVEIEKFARVLEKASQHKIAEIRLRINHIRQYLHSLTSERIAFISDRDPDDLIYGIYIMDVASRNTRKLIEGNDCEFFKCLSWSPDATKISFIKKDMLYIIDIDRENLIRLTETNFSAWRFVWHPNSTKGLLVSWWIMDLIDLDKNESIKLTTPGLEMVVFPVWSPDGTRIAFELEKEAYRHFEIYVMDIDGKNRKNLTGNLGSARYPAWSPDGTKIAFLSERKDAIFVMDADGKNPKNLTGDALKVKRGFPVWSPDGTKIAFVAGKYQEYEIYVIDADGKNLKKLTEQQSYDGHLAWSPDGTKIAFVGKAGDNEDIYVINADGTNLTKLTDNPETDIEPVWYPLSLPEISALFATK